MRRPVVHVIGLELTDFRNYEHQSVEFEPGVTVVVGSNGQGKTNLVEAIGYCATLSSHRVASDQPLVRRGADAAGIGLRVQRGARKARLDLLLQPGRVNRAKLNSSPLPRPREALGLLQAVVFAPEDLGLIRGDPSERRRFLDTLLIQRQPRYAGVRADLDRVLKQRNALLKSLASTRRRPDSTDLHTLQVWNEQLIGVGAQLMAGRLALLRALQPHAERSYAAVADGQGDLSMGYLSAALPATDRSQPTMQGSAHLEDTQVACAEGLRACLSEREPDELRRGVTLVGPQRDDLQLMLDGEPAKGYASHGESWSIALALRLACFELLQAEAIDDGAPVLILDDVFAELDAGRRDQLVGQVLTAEQTLITAAVAADVPAGLGGRMLTVASGKVYPA